MVGKQSTTLDDSFVERYAMASAGSLTYYKSDAEETDPVLGEDGGSSSTRAHQPRAPAACRRIWR